GCLLLDAVNDEQMARLAVAASQVVGEQCWRDGLVLNERKIGPPGAGPGQPAVVVLALVAARLPAQADVACLAGIAAQLDEPARHRDRQFDPHTGSSSW